MPRQLNSMFDINDDLRLMKRSNGEVVPDDEPVIVLRARDRLTLPTMLVYEILAKLDGCNDWFMERITPALDGLREFQKDHPERMKQPGITKGK